MLKIETLVEDIYKTLTTGTEVPEDKINAFAVSLAMVLSERLKKREPRQLSMSALGTPDRQLWYKINTPEDEEPLDGPTLMKFMYGDLIEQLVLFLADLSGHEVHDQQLEVEESGVKGHLDCSIDDDIVDVKSASRFAFEKFKKGLTKENDSFGYLTQLESYMSVCERDKAFFLVVNKESGELYLYPHSKPIDDEAFVELVHSKKKIICSSTPPKTKCYDPVPHGKSGNMKLATNCGYCGFKTKCWDNLIKYEYSNGPVYFTHVVKEPKVEKSEF